MLKRSILILALALSCLAWSAEDRIKVAGYNIFFLDADISEGRKANLQTILERLDADIIAFQEIAGLAALQNILPDTYEIAMIDDPRDFQETALAVRKPLKVLSKKYVFPEAEHEFAFPKARNLLEVRVAHPNGRELLVFVHHAKSRRHDTDSMRSRILTDAQREKASTMMVDYLKRECAGRSIILIGDFNDNPDDRSLNILETGDPEAQGGPENDPGPFLHNLMEPLAAKDICTHGLNHLHTKIENGTFNPVVPGSRDENNKWRNKAHEYKNIKVKQTLLDMILVSSDLAEHVVDSGVFNETVAIQGKRSRIKFETDGVRYLTRGDLASDHIPVWAVIELQKAEPDPSVHHGSVD